MQEHIISLKNSPHTPQAAPPVQPQQKKSRARRLFAVFFTLVAMGIVFVVCYAVYTHVAGSLGNSNPGGDTEQVVDAVSKLMLLPNETPTLAVVSDLEKLKGQAFFANAKQGDIVLMFAHAQKAVLYSPALNKIIEVAPITNTQP